MQAYNAAPTCLQARHASACCREPVAARSGHSVVGCLVPVFVLRWPIPYVVYCVAAAYIPMCDILNIQLTEIIRCRGSITRDDVADMPTSGKLMPAHPWMGPSARGPSILSIYPCIIHAFRPCAVTIAVPDELQRQKLDPFVCGPRRAFVYRGF